MSTSRREQFLALHGHAPVVMPSLLLCDFGNLEREVRDVEQAGARGLHLDVMDGHFVPNLTYGPTIVEAVNRISDLPLDVHLMINQPAESIDQYIDAGADGLTIHAEAVAEPGELLESIRSADVAAGLAINPRTPAEAIDDATLSVCDLVLAMSVEPGHGGQAFDPTALEKLTSLRSRAEEATLLEVDGGVNNNTIAACVGAGAQLLVVGSAIFRKEDYSVALSELNTLAAS